MKLPVANAAIIETSIAGNMREGFPLLYVTTPLADNHGELSFIVKLR